MWWCRGAWCVGWRCDGVGKHGVLNEDGVLDEDDEFTVGGLGKGNCKKYLKRGWNQNKGWGNNNLKKGAS